LSWSAHGAQVRVALRAICVGCGRQAPVSPMFRVARGAVGREQLIGMMRGTVMTAAARLIARLGAEGGDLLNMALAAPCREDSMPCGHLSTAVHAIVSSNPRPGQPHDRQRRQ